MCAFDLFHALQFNLNWGHTRVFASPSAAQYIRDGVSRDPW